MMEITKKVFDLVRTELSEEEAIDIATMVVGESVMENITEEMKNSDDPAAQLCSVVLLAISNDVMNHTVEVDMMETSRETISMVFEELEAEHDEEP